MGQRRHEYSYTLEDAYKGHMKDTRNDMSKRLTKKEFTTLFEGFIERCMDKVIHGAQLWTLPYNLGEVYVEKEYSPKYVDRQASKKAGKKVYAYNDHTGGFTYRTVWSGPLRVHTSKFYKHSVRKYYTKKLRNVIMQYVEDEKYLPAFNIIDKRKDVRPLRKKIYV